MATEDVTVARRGDVDRAVAPIVLAFATDPFVRWLLSDSTRYLTAFPRLVRLHAETVVDAGGVYRSGDFRAAALWYSPGVYADRVSIGAIFDGILPDEVEATLSLVLEGMGAARPSEPHLYLRMIGVDPALQGRGYGSLLMRIALEECDRRELPAYLEATSMASRSLYERHGFTTTAEIREADAPPLWPMLRPASRS